MSLLLPLSPSVRIRLTTSFTFRFPRSFYVNNPDVTVFRPDSSKGAEIDRADLTHKGFQTMLSLLHVRLPPLPRVSPDFELTGPCFDNFTSSTTRMSEMSSSTEPISSGRPSSSLEKRPSSSLERSEMESTSSVWTLCTRFSLGAFPPSPPPPLVCVVKDDGISANVWLCRLPDKVPRLRTTSRSGARLGCSWTTDRLRLSPFLQPSLIRAKSRWADTFGL